MKENKYLEEAWEMYLRTYTYSSSKEVLLKAGIKQPYLDNILHTAFIVGWRSRDPNASAWAIQYHYKKQLKQKQK